MCGLTISLLLSGQGGKVVGAWRLPFRVEEEPQVAWRHVIRQVQHTCQAAQKGAP